jgi:hypothetical protein
MSFGFFRTRKQETKKLTGRFSVYYCDTSEAWLKATHIFAQAEPGQYDSEEGWFKAGYFYTQAEAEQYIDKFRRNHPNWDIVEQRGLHAELKEYLLTEKPLYLVIEWRRLIERGCKTSDDYEKFRVLVTAIKCGLALADRQSVVEAVDQEEREDQDERERAARKAAKQAAASSMSRFQAIAWCVLTMITTLIAVAVYRHLTGGAR